MKNSKEAIWAQILKNDEEYRKKYNETKSGGERFFEILAKIICFYWFFSFITWIFGFKK